MLCVSRSKQREVEWMKSCKLTSVIGIDGCGGGSKLRVGQL